jgi:hypothetical protein
VSTVLRRLDARTYQTECVECLHSLPLTMISRVVIGSRHVHLPLL